MAIFRTNVSLLEGRGVVDTITCHSHNLSLPLATLHNDKLLLGGGSGKHDLRVVPQNLINLGRGHVTEVTAVDNSSLRLSDQGKQNNVSNILLFHQSNC